MAENNIQSTTQEYLDIHDITNDLVIMKDGTTSLILSVDAMNFGLLAEEEQDSIIYAYAGLLNSLNYPIQVLVKSQTKDVTSYLRLIQEQEQQADSPENRQRIRRYREFVSNLIHERNVLDKKFYVVIPAGPLELGLLSADSVIPGRQTFDVTSVERSVLLEKARNILEPKRDHLISQFARIGLNSRQLTTQEIIQYFYVSYNPEAAEGQEIADSNSYSTPLVKASFEGIAMPQDNSNNQQNQPAQADQAPNTNQPAAGQPPANQPAAGQPAQPGTQNQPEQSQPEQPGAQGGPDQPNQSGQQPQPEQPNQPGETVNPTPQQPTQPPQSGDTPQSGAAAMPPQPNKPADEAQPATTPTNGGGHQGKPMNDPAAEPTTPTPPGGSLPDQNNPSQIPVETETIKKPAETPGGEAPTAQQGAAPQTEVPVSPNTDQQVTAPKDGVQTEAQEAINQTVGQLPQNPSPQAGGATPPNQKQTDSAEQTNESNDDGQDGPPPIPEIN